MSQSPRPLNSRINFCPRKKSSRVLQYALSISVLTLLTGCGALSDVRSFSTPYSTPDGGETARLRVISDGMVRAVPKSDCVDFRLPGAGVMVAFRDGYANRNGESLGMPDDDKHSSSTVMTELLVPAGQPIAFHYIGAQCYNMFRFVPKAGADYQLDAAGRYKCTVTLKQLSVKTTELPPLSLEDSKLCRATDNF
ncbi:MULTISPECIES: hypothetical protein [Pseudomonas]|uniref:hypothetical protein n=1 Tax=Pseudomonas TaxID=286 RepID=UPI00025FF031|nr:MULTISPECIES: hypothetical protein [Pseudomonas]EIK66527.1 hypothetical protein PflQ8_4051 [Pseudomonas fluorescens Q8r1-96]RDI09433.1 hypothetical protein DFO59_101858 [Pseudomonas fluorescens]KAB0524057.1 hypothetical protein F7R20_18660 [Pseudomonas brassicacearum subsp. brassicacearum]NJP60939.1 hypothetical protein [Pseudomonas brassicacearum]QEO80027.1 hypothetical protein ELZ14_21715 [Pseudomonas brassicacearum]